MNNKTTPTQLKSIVQTIISLDTFKPIIILTEFGSDCRNIIRDIAEEKDLTDCTYDDICGVLKLSDIDEEDITIILSPSDKLLVEFLTHDYNLRYVFFIMYEDNIVDYDALILNKFNIINVKKD